LQDPTEGEHGYGSDTNPQHHEAHRRSWYPDWRAVCAVLPTGLLTGALWQQTGPAAATALALAFLALAAALLATIRKLSAA
jgi:hypothetical protein